ncbi:MAG: hypothetical protein MPI95_08180 [Nitrosopumilus sp.]|nr:hypothetical protein [Nitrosopumilus sp.]MDA7959038.1 hypothetical protein [Nitrosopumilus sp.]
MAVPRLSYKNGRHYEHDGQRYSSVTEVLGILSREGLAAWREGLCARLGREAGMAEARRISAGSSAVGRSLHKMIEKYVGNEDPGDDPEGLEVSARSLLGAAMPYLSRIDNVAAQELPMLSRRWRVAGTVDCVAEYLGRPAIIDFKNSRRPKRREYLEGYMLQTAWYSMIWEENTGQRIDDLVVVVCNWDMTVDVACGRRAAYEAGVEDVVERWRAERAGSGGESG